MRLFTEFTNIHFFSLYGLIAVIVIVIPNLIFMKKAQDTRLDDIDTPPASISLMEFVSRFMLNFTLVLIEYQPLSKYWLYAAGIIFLIYLLNWFKFAIQGSFYPNIYLKKFLGMPIPFDILNGLYFCIISIWLCNLLSLLLAIVYSVTRIYSATIAYQDLSTRIDD